MNRGKLILIILLIAAAVFALSAYLGASDKGTHEGVQSTVVINEVMSSNKGSVPDENGDYPDWVELMNTGTDAIDIGGWGLTDDFTAGVKYVFPSGTKLEPGECIVVFCSGDVALPHHAAFKLNAASDALVLYDPSGTTLETLTLKAVTSGNSLAREDGSSSWSQMKPSPGFPNTPEGIAQYEAGLQAVDEIGVYINEFMASNATTIADESGAFSDWIELYNATDADVDLSGFGISDSLAQPMKYQLPKGTVIPRKGYLLIFCSGNASAEGALEIHVPFSLRAYEEDVVLSNRRGAILDSFSFSRQEGDASMARMPDGTGELSLCSRPTPGYPNDDAGYTAFSASVERPGGGEIILSEIMAKNIASLAGPDSAYYDWIELANTSSGDLSLAGYALSDNPKNPAKWTFPDVTIPAGGYLVVYASGNDLTASAANLQTNFSISGGGETVYLFSPEGALMDRIALGTALNDVSLGRDANNALAYFTSSTPGKANGAGMAGISSLVSFDTAPGIYDGPIEITLSAAEGETIYYTLDCTTPTDHSTKYTGPIRATENTVVRAVAVRGDFITNATVTGTFLFTSDGVDHKLPVVTLVTDPDNLWDEKTGIYAFGEKYDPTLSYAASLETAQFYTSKSAPDEWERPGSLEVFDDQGTRVFQQNIGLRIAGSFGRGRAQKGFNILARDGYGKDRMEYPFFEGLGFSEYKAIVLRAGAQDQNNGKFRDELATGLLAGSDADILYQAYKPYVLYLNGEYWGVYFMKEKRNRFFVAQHEGSGDNVNLDIIRSEDTAYYGSTSEWRDIMAYVRKNGLTSQTAYDYVAERVDLDSFMDYMICEIYSANSDVWNIQYYKLDGGKWKWIYYDFCWSFGATYDESRDRANHQTLAIRRLSSKPCSDLFNALLLNAKWKDAFVRRFAELLNTIYSSENVLGKIDELYAIVEPEIAREREKFNGATWMGVKQHAEVIGTYDSFLRQVDYMRYFAENRPASIKRQLKSELGLSDAYMREVFGDG